MKRASTETSIAADPHAGPVERAALAFARFAERWVPDAFGFALAATVLVVLLGATVGHTPLGAIVDAWGGGVWELLPFTMQMALVVVTGHVLATSPPVARLIERLARLPRTPRQAVALVAAFALASSWLNWGFSLVFSAMLALAVARRLPRVDYRALAASSFLGLGSVWAQGLSGSAALQMATPGALSPTVRQLVEAGGSVRVPGGLVPLGHTIFLWQSLVSVGLELLLVPLVMVLVVPIGPRARTAADLGVPLDDARGEVAPVEETPPTPGERLERSPLPTVLVLALGLAYLVRYFAAAPDAIAALNLNTCNLALLLLGFACHGTPLRLARAVARAVPSTAAVLLQFPFYAAIARVITTTHLSERLAHLFVRAASPTTFPPLVALYSAVLGVFVPSGGSKWIVEAPYVLAAAHAEHVHLGWTVACYDLGEALANLVQPFWMLPVLALFRLRARDVMGYTFVVFLVLLPVVLALVTLLGRTLPYPL